MKEVKDILYEIYDNYSSVDHKLCLQEDFPKEIKRILLNKIKYAIFKVPDYRDAEEIYSIDNFGSSYAEGTDLDIDKTEYKKLSKEEIANLSKWPDGTSEWPVGSLFIKPHGNIIIAACYGRGEWTWEFYFAVERSALANLSIEDYLHGKNISINNIVSQTKSWKKGDMKNIESGSIYIPIKPVSYDSKTVSNQLGKDGIDYDSLEQYTKKTFKLNDTLFNALANQSSSGFMDGIVVAALKGIPSSSMRSKFARWCISKGLSPSDSYYKPKETTLDPYDIKWSTPHKLSKIISNTRNEIRRLANDYTQEKDPKTKKDILKSIEKKKKEYSYYSTFSDGNEALSDTVGCYYLLRGLVNMVRKIIQSGKAVFADSDALSAKRYTKYIKDTVEKAQKDIETTKARNGSDNDKYKKFYEEMKKSLTTIIDQANSLIEELKHSDVDKEYEVLKSTVDIMDNFRDKVKAINDMKKDVLKEDLEETSPYTNIKSNGIYSLNTGWVKHPVQQDIPDIDMEEFEKEFKVWEDKYFDLLDDLNNK